MQQLMILPVIPVHTAGGCYRNVSPSSRSCSCYRDNKSRDMICPIDTCRYYATKGLTSRMQHLRGGGGGNLLGSACHFFEAGTHLRSASLNV